MHDGELDVTVMSYIEPMTRELAEERIALSSAMTAYLRRTLEELEAPVPNRLPRPCTTPGCPRMTYSSGRCNACTARAAHDPRSREGAAADGAYAGEWPNIRRAYLAAHPRCALCPRMATVADHYPASRRQLVAAGTADPDAPHRLRPLCASCHSKQTAQRQPGGFNRRHQ